MEDDRRSLLIYASIRTGAQAQALGDISTS